MKETHFFYVPDASCVSELPPAEAQHAVRVLRLHEGDEVMLMDGRGVFCRAELSLTSNHHCQYKVLEVLPQEPQWKGKVHLAIAPTKLIDRMEWMIEKAVEIGVDDISFLNCRFSERRVLKLQRLESIVVSAMKQSRKAWKTQMRDMTDFKAFIQMPFEGRRYIAHCYDEIPRKYLYDELRHVPDGDALVLVGPEGDFSVDEVQMAMASGFVSVHLGKSRLRTETAGLSAVMMMQLSKS